MKTRSSKSQKIDILPKGKFWQKGKPWFWSKNGHYSDFVFLGNIGQENVFYYILERNNPFLGYKNKKFKESKNWHFSIFTHSFGPKMVISPTFFFLAM